MTWFMHEPKPYTLYTLNQYVLSGQAMLVGLRAPVIVMAYVGLVPLAVLLHHGGPSVPLMIPIVVSCIIP